MSYHKRIRPCKGDIPQDKVEIGKSSTKLSELANLGDLAEPQLSSTKYPNQMEGDKEL